MNKGYGLLKLREIIDRNQADLLRGLFVMVAIADAAPLQDDEIYLYQLIGMRVQSVNHEALGTITEILETGANDVYVVQSETYGEILVPVTKETVIKTDVEHGVVTVQLPEGLLPGTP